MMVGTDPDHERLATMNVIRYTPGPDEWAHRFGGDPAGLSIAPADVVQVAQPRIW